MKIWLVKDKWFLLKRPAVQHTCGNPDSTTGSWVAYDGRCHDCHDVCPIEVLMKYNFIRSDDPYPYETKHHVSNKIKR